MTTKVSKIWMAVQHVKRARDLLREAGCKPSADTMAKALKSAEGAHRHAKIHSDVAEAVREVLREPCPELGDDHSELDVDPVTDPAYAGHTSPCPPAIVDARPRVSIRYVGASVNPPVPHPLYHPLRSFFETQELIDVTEEAREHYAKVVKEGWLCEVVRRNASRIRQALAAI